MTAPYFADEHVTLHHGDCLDVLRELPDASVDAVVTDPPYGIAFMGKAWDQPGEFGSQRRNGQPAVHAREAGRDRAQSGDTGAMDAGRYDLSQHAMRNFQRWCEAWATECLRVLKPGGHFLAFGGSRTWHRLAAAVEDAGFEIRDSIAWLYGSGFPKSLDVAKAIERSQDSRLVEEYRFTEWMRTTGLSARQLDEATGTVMGTHYLTAGAQPAIPTAPLFEKMRGLLPEVPAWVEQVIAEREAAKAESRGRNEGVRDRFLATLGDDRDRPGATNPAAEAWQGWGTALKPSFEPIVVARKPLAGTVAANVLAHGTGALNIDACRVATTEDRSRPPRTPNAILGGGKGTNLTASESNPIGRWPTNVVLDDDQAAELDRQTGVLTSGKMHAGQARKGRQGQVYADMAPDAVRADTYGDSGGASRFFPVFRYEAKASTSERPRAGEVMHPTVKPLDLMRWLVRLVTPPGGVVLEPFAGSGTTAEACVIEGFRCIAIEREADYLPLIVGRLSKPIQMGLGLDFGEATA